MPTNSGWRSLTTLLPSIVAVIGMPAPSANREQRLLQPEAMDLHAGDDHRPLGGRDAADRLGHGLGQDLRVAGGRFAGRRVRAVGNDAHHVARQFDVARPPVANHGGQHAVDLAQGRLRIVQLRLGAADAAKHLRLRVEVLHAMVQERIVEPLPHARASR